MKVDTIVQLKTQRTQPLTLPLPLSIQWMEGQRQVMSPLVENWGLNLIARVIWLIIKELQGQEDQKEHGIDRVMHE